MIDIIQGTDSPSLERVDKVNFPPHQSRFARQLPLKGKPQKRVISSLPLEGKVAALADG